MNSSGGRQVKICLKFCFIATVTTTIFSAITILPVHPTGTKNQHFVREFSVRDFFLKSEHWFHIIFIVAVPLLLCLRIQLSFINKNFLWSTHIVLAFSEMKGVYNCMTRCGRQILLPVLQQNQKSCKSSFLSQWRRIIFVLSTEATIPDEDYEENIMMLDRSRSEEQRKGQLTLRMTLVSGANPIMQTSFNCTASYVKFDNNVLADLTQYSTAL